MLTRTVVYVAGFTILWVLLRFIRNVKARQVLLLVFSYLFYASWDAWFLGLLVFSSIVNYGLGRYLQQRPSVARLWLGIGFNLLLLGTFKYLPPMASGTGWLGPLRHIVLPLGISFWTFEAMSYLFDLYREEELNPTLIEFCLFLAFWPTVFAGPICRLPELLPQFRSRLRSSLADIEIGMQRVLTGIFMMALSRLLAQGFGSRGIEAGFAQAGRAWNGLDVWCLAIGYGFQLFFDFAGYSHLVIGAAQILGFRLPENFQIPYLSGSPSIFWNRWHMSLSFWIRDYLFLPLVMLFSAVWWRYVVLLFSMIVFGLWHKASWTFLAWGMYQGSLLVLHRLWQQLKMRWQFRLPAFVEGPLGWAITFSSICLGWVLFRAPSLGQGAAMLKAAIVPSMGLHHVLPRSLYLLVAAAALGYFAVIGIGEIVVSIGKSRDASGVLHEDISDWRLLNRDRWVWVMPLAIVASLYALVIFEPGQTAASPMLYRLF